jgi:predicted RNase H-like HicB family nuclease
MNSSDLAYYKNLEYNIIIEKEMDEDDQWFIAYANELGKYSCYGRGDTREEAIGSFLEEKDVFLEYLFNEGLEIPEPKKKPEDKHSGFLMFERLPTFMLNWFTRPNNKGFH